MDDFEQTRRTFPMTATSLGFGAANANTGVDATAHGGSVLLPAEGEHLVHFRDGGAIYIKTGAATCSSPGAPPKALTRDQIRETARTKYGTEFR